MSVRAISATAPANWRLRQKKAGPLADASERPRTDHGTLSGPGPDRGYIIVPLQRYTQSQMKPFNLLVVGACLCVAAPLASAQSAPAAASPTPEFGASLALRMDRIVADSTRPIYGWLSQTNPVAFTSKGALQLK